jgi:hypothetical protein
MNNQIQTKNELDNKFLAVFDKEVEKIEKGNIRNLTKFYNKNYDQGISNFLEYNTTRYESLFTNRDLEAEYQKMYISIGNHIAKWYFKIFKKYQTKNDFGPYETEWEKSFANYGGQVAATNVTLVGGTAKQTLIKLTQQLMRDPEFMQLGNEAKARILKQKFNRYSKYQANRLVRTESTRAANFAVEKSAKTLFSENDLSKRWLAVMDGKERIWHRAANGQTVRMTESFQVGGESMKRPGEGSARNVINCRCRIIPIPDPNAIPVTELDELGVGLGQSRIQDFSLANLTNVVVEAMQVAGTTLINTTATTIKEFRKQITETFEDVGLKINKLQLSSKRSLDEYNKIQSQLKNLINRFNYATYHNDASVNLLFRSGSRLLGYIESSISRGKTLRINLGSPTPYSNSRMRMSKMSGNFDRRFNSHVDPNKQFLATTVHEMAHLLTTSHTAQREFILNISNKGKQFWNDLIKIRTRYQSEIIATREAGKANRYNKIFLGRYASKNADEFFAEAWTEYHLSSTPSPYAIEVGKLIEKYYGK